MDVAYQLGKVALPIADNGLVAILEEMAMPAMAQIVADRVSGQKTPHEFRQAWRSTAQQYVGVVRHERPGVNGCVRLAC